MGGTRNSLEVYVQDFEDMLLETTAGFYSRESAKWAEEDSFPDYMVKAEDRIKQEQERVAHYLHSSTEEKLLRVCDQQLLEVPDGRVSNARPASTTTATTTSHPPPANPQVPEAALLEKENSGCEALLRDNKTDDLSRMYRLFARIATGLTPIGNIVRKHIQDVGLALVKGQTAKPDDKETDLMPYVQQLLDIHDKYTELVGTGPEKGCFQGHTIFHKAMKEAFEVFVNKDIGKTTTAELLSQVTGRHCQHCHFHHHHSRRLHLTSSLSSPSPSSATTCSRRAASACRTRRSRTSSRRS